MGSHDRRRTMNTRTLCTGVSHLELEDIPGPNDTIDRTIVVDARTCDCEPGHYDQHDAWHPLGSRCTCTPPDQRVTRRTGRLAAQEQWLRDHPDAALQSHAERVTRPSDQRVTRVESDATS
jgi:hypothetical protein